MRGTFIPFVGLACISDVLGRWSDIKAEGVLDAYPNVFQQPPPPPPAYMVDNTDNLSGQAPNKGKYNGAQWPYSGSFEGYMRRLRAGNITGTPMFPNTNSTMRPPVGWNATLPRNNRRQAGGGYWLTELAPLGQQPHAGRDNYVFYRDVTEYGASNKGDVDISEAINAAIEDGERCGMECGNTFSIGALVYFPPGTYLVCTPIIQLYLTQFVGNPHDRPIIKGCSTFTGIALVDVDPYIPNEAMPDGTGVNWYINQNQFFRQIRNFVFDLTEMPLKTDEHGQSLAPTGIHWQVSQACSLQNLLFRMPTASARGGNVTHVGIFTENGSGGFVSDLEFEGGAIGWRVGSQQYTARGLKFTNCITAIQMIWDWGFNWQDIEINGGTVGLNISGKGGIRSQGIGSISLIDSSINNVPIGILTREAQDAPNIVIENTNFNGVAAPVQVEGGTILLAGSQKVDLWAHGRRYQGGKGGSIQTGMVAGRMPRPAPLLGSDGKLFTRSRPDYRDLGAGSFLVATNYGCRNDGVGDNAMAITTFLRIALLEGKVAYFPAGNYLVESTVDIPVGSRILGSGWSQIQATGPFFSDMKNPQVVARVGNKGDVGILEISDIIFSVKGPTAGAIMVEWNVKASSPGAAGMWDAHIRVGGAIGSDLAFEDCPKFGFSNLCITAAMLLHVTSRASGYFENVWAWVADHDNDKSLYWEFDKLASQISIYGGRGMLIESQGPCWFYGTGSEHVVLYQYQLYNAKNIYMGHIQTETPYFQPVPVAPAPFKDQLNLGPFRGDPSFAQCKTDGCREAWGLRILNSQDVVIHSAGLYSWFVNYGQSCLTAEDCQEHIMEVRASSRIAIYNIFTKGVVHVASGHGKQNTIMQSEGNQRGYTTEISLWMPVDGSDNVVYVGPEVYRDKKVQCQPPCILVLPPAQLSSKTVILIPPYTTSLEVGSMAGWYYAVTTTTITIMLDPITTRELHQSNVEVEDGQVGGGFKTTPSVPVPDPVVTVTNGFGAVTARTLSLPAWPDITNGPPDKWSTKSGPWVSGGTGSNGTLPTTPGSNAPSSTEPGSTTPGGSTGSYPPQTSSVLILPCHRGNRRHYLGNFNATITLGKCPPNGVTTMNQKCDAPTTTVRIEEDTTKSFSLDCTLFTGTGVRPSNTGAPLPTHTVWDGELEWEDDDEDDDEDYDVDDDGKSTCKLWFFHICLKRGGWRWKFPSGIYPIGPPPLPKIKWPPGARPTVDPPGPWPRITIGWNKILTYPTLKPTAQCTTRTADICLTTTTLEIKTEGTKTTTSTRSHSTCDTIRGCRVNDDDWETTTKISCSTRLFPRVEIQANPTLTPGPQIQARAGDECRDWDVIIYPESNDGPSDGLVYILQQPVHPNDPDGEQWLDRVIPVSAGPNREFTAFYYIPEVPIHVYEEWEYLEETENYVLKIADMRRIQAKNRARPLIQPAAVGKELQEAKPPIEVPNDPNQAAIFRVGAANKTLNARAPLELIDEARWDLSLMSIPPGKLVPGEYKVLDPIDKVMAWKTTLDDSFCQGQFIYLVEGGVRVSHQDFTQNEGPTIQFLRDIPFPSRHDQIEVDIRHGTYVASKLNGRMSGVCRKAQVIVARIKGGSPAEAIDHIIERHLLVPLVLILDDIMRNPGRAEHAIVNFSQGLPVGWANQFTLALKRTIREVVRRLEALGVTVIAATHNDFREGEPPNPIMEEYTFPGHSLYLENVILASGIDMNSKVSKFNNYAPFMAMAPGHDITVASHTQDGSYGEISGASFATPLIAATIAYWRGLPNMIFAAALRDERARPTRIKKLVAFMHRSLSYQGHIKVRDDVPDDQRSHPDPVASLWNGDVPGGNCLVRPDLPFCPEDLRDPNLDIDQLRPFGSDRTRSGSGGSDISFSVGPPSPTCTSGCGILCTGFYCEPNPTGKPPWQWDPKDPAGPDYRPDPINTDEPPFPTTRFPDLPTSFPPLPSDGDCRPPETATTTTTCNGSGGQEACGVTTICVRPTLPTLPPDDGCVPPQTATTTTACNRGACAIQTICVTPDPPTTTPRPNPTTVNPGPGPGPTDNPTQPQLPIEFLAVIVLQTKNWSRLGGCQNNAPYFAIHRFKQHPTSGKVCGGYMGETIAGSRTRMGQDEVGAYDHGWSVARTSYGANVHNGKGMHQRCERDDLQIYACGFQCYDTLTRTLRCDGVWRFDG